MADYQSPKNRVQVLRRSVIKTYGERSGLERAARERAALRSLAGSGLPVPGYLSSGELSDGRPWLMMSRCPGSPPSDAERPAHEMSAGIGTQLGRLAASLHEMSPPAGFDHRTRASDGSVSTDSVSGGTIRERANRMIAQAKDRGLLGPSLLSALTLGFDRYEAALLSAPSKPVLVHRDLQPRNVLVDKTDVITGIVDFETSGGGDPAEDFSRFALDWDREGFVSFCSGYDASLGPDAAERVTYYTLLWAGLIGAYVADHWDGYLEPAREFIARVADGELPDLG